MHHWFRIPELEPSVHCADGEVRSIKVACLPKVMQLAKEPGLSFPDS